MKYPCSICHASHAAGFETLAVSFGCKDTHLAPVWGETARQKFAGEVIHLTLVDPRGREHLQMPHLFKGGRAQNPSRDAETGGGSVPFEPLPTIPSQIS